MGALEADSVENLSFAAPSTPFGLMRFRLTFDGDLPAANPRRKETWRKTKWKIREQISQQLIELYQTNPVLNLKPRILMIVHEVGDPEQPPEAFREPITIAGRGCIPLVRKSLAVSCSLDVLFLRQQKAGELISGGDIDNRMQILFDALQMPGKSDFDSDVPEIIPQYYLLEDDSLVTGVSIQTDRLLAGPKATKNHALLLIDVTIRVMQITGLNIGFLGD
jgi:hypothetical protein